jgi:hypothetical protein
MEDGTEVVNELEGSELFDQLVDQAIAEAQPLLNGPEDEEPEVAEETPVVKAEESKSSPVDEGLKRLTEKETQLVAREKELEAKLAELRGKPAGLDADKLKKLAETNVSGMLAELGLDQEHIMDVLIAEKLGDKAPPALKEKLRDYGLKKEIESIRAERDNERRLAEARSYYDKVSTEAREFVKGIDEKVAPEVSLVVKEDSDFVHQLVLQELDKDAREKVRRGETNGKLLTYAEAVGNIEKLFAKIATAVRKGSESKTNSNRTTAVVKPVTKPKNDGKPRDEIKELEDEGLRRALADYKRLEAARKR